MELQFNDLPKAISLLSNEVVEIKRLLLLRSNEQTSDPEQLLTIKQAGEFLNLSVPTLYGYVQRAEIPVNKRGKRLYFSKKELTDWIKAGRKKTRAEINDEAETYLKKRGGNV